MDYQFNPDKIDKQTAFENLKFIDKDKNGLGGLNSGYCHSFAPFTLFMSSPTFIRTIRLFKKEQLQLHNELQAFVQDKNQWCNYSCNQYPTLRTLLQKVYGNGWENNYKAWNSVVYVLYFIAKICACTDENGKITNNKGKSNKYNKGVFVDVNAQTLYEAIIEFRDSHKMKHSSDVDIFFSFLTHCSFIMGNGKLSSVPLQNGITLDIKSGEPLEQSKDWKNHKDSFLKALREAGDRAMVSAGGNHIFVFYRGNDNRYHAIGSLGNETYDSIEDAVKAWATLTGVIIITTQKPQKELYESHLDGQLNAHLAVQDITHTSAYLCKNQYYDNNIPYTFIDYGKKICDYVDEYTMKKWGLQAHNLNCANQPQQTRSSVFENIDKIANGIPMNNQELMNNQMIMNNNVNFNNNGNNVNFNNMNNQMMNNNNNMGMNQMMNNGGKQMMNNNQFNNMNNPQIMPPNNMKNPMVMNNQMGMNNPMGMNPQIIPPNNMNNPMMNNMGNNNMGMNNQIGMNNMGNNKINNPKMNNNMQPNDMVMNNQIGMNNMVNNNMGINNQIGMNNMGNNKINNPMMNNMGNNNMGINNQIGMNNMGNNKINNPMMNNMGNNNMGMNNQIGMNNMGNNKINNQIGMNNMGMNPQIIPPNTNNPKMNNMGMNPQIIPPNTNNPKMNNMGMNPQIMPPNTNNQIGMNNMNSQIMNIPKSIKIEYLDKIIEDDMRKRCDKQSYTQLHELSPKDVNNDAEHLLGLSCLPKISSDTSECGEKFYWKPCC